MAEKPELSKGEAEALIRADTNRVVTLHVHSDGLVTATVMLATNVIPGERQRIQAEVDEALSRRQHQYRIVEKKKVQAARWQ